MADTGESAANGLLASFNDGRKSLNWRDPSPAVVPPALSPLLSSWDEGGAPR